MKTAETIELENAIYSATVKQGVFGCHEVTIGWFGSERVDYMTYDTNGIFRCYEIKVSLSDFHSKAKKTFCGHFNYYVMSLELYQKVKDEIPKEIGVYIGGCSKKRATRVEPTIDVDILKNSMLRSLAREAQEKRRLEDPDIIKRYARTASKLQTDVREKNRYINGLLRFIHANEERRAEYREWQEQEIENVGTHEP